MAVSCLQADLRSCGGGVDLRVLSSFPQALQSDKYKIFPNSLSFSISFPSSLRRDATVQDIYVFGISKPRCSLCALICFPKSLFWRENARAEKWWSFGPDLGCSLTLAVISSMALGKSYLHLGTQFLPCRDILKIVIMYIKYKSPA